ncbi:glycosyl transferase family 1 [Deltaproteobacteria bacterium]|nr:glycosyl transferase family 1 [Deltaproteobacteria bacterium]
MKIALVHRRFTTNGGTERYLVGLARFLVTEGHAVSVLCNDVREDLRAEPGVEFVHLPMWRPAKALSLAWSVRRALGKRSFDAVMGLGRHGGHHLYRAGGGSHLDYLRRSHALRRWLSPSDWIDLALDRSAVRSARICIANSNLGAEGLRDDYGARRVEVVYNGVDLARFRPDEQVRAAVRSELGAAGNVAVFVGNGFARKGLDVAIAALPADWALWVVGGDAPVAAPPRVRFLGSQPQPERFLQAADVLLLPTRYDPFANVCLEAMACGIPALTTSSNGAAEVLPEPWMICDSAGAYAAALTRLTPELGARCRAVAECFPPERSYRRALALLLEASS